MESHVLALLIDAAVAVRENSFSALAEKYMMSKAEAIRSAVASYKIGHPEIVIGNEWVELLDLLLTDPLWNDSLEWTARVLSEE
jgi:hypothetical protein